MGTCRNGIRNALNGGLSVIWRWQALPDIVPFGVQIGTVISPLPPSDPSRQ